MKKSILIFLSISFLFAESIGGGLAEKIERIANYYNIDPKVIYTIIKIESNFNPFSINANFKSKEKKKAFIKLLKQYGVKYSVWGKAVSVSPKTKKTAKMLIENLKLMKVSSYDIGLMQINSKNLTETEEKLALNPEYSIIKGTKILRKCFDYNNYNIYKTLICYNGSTVYAKKFYLAYIKLFGTLAKK
ncbi:transglycosylase SLT domain-containing protein [Caminibacter pacificus]|nr:transglycosylase SLT domain-containing protein [Caminibacter pacificus]ROR38773.1 type IV secretion system protein VirB1 [Caminibacter pacificus]